MSKISLISSKKTPIRESTSAKGGRKPQAFRFELKLDLSSKKATFNNVSFPELVKKQAKALKKKKSEANNAVSIFSYISHSVASSFVY